MFHTQVLNTVHKHVVCDPLTVAPGQASFSIFPIEALKWLFSTSKSLWTGIQKSGWKMCLYFEFFWPSAAYIPNERKLYTGETAV